MPKDVPTAHDFRDPAHARHYTAKTAEKQAFRQGFFDAFVAALNGRFDKSFTVIELGSGPGHLGEQILARTRAAHFTGLDFSAPMHEIAAETLAVLPGKASFVERDFGKADWAQGLGTFDAAVTMQSAHETRHKRYLPAFLAETRRLIAPGGVLLFADFYPEPGTWKNAELFVARRYQPTALKRAGFSQVRRLHDDGGMALYEAAA